MAQGNASNLRLNGTSHKIKRGAQYFACFEVDNLQIAPGNDIRACSRRVDHKSNRGQQTQRDPLFFELLIAVDVNNYESTRPVGFCLTQYVSESPVRGKGNRLHVNIEDVNRFPQNHLLADSFPFFEISVVQMFRFRKSRSARIL